MHASKPVFIVLERFKTQRISQSVTGLRAFTLVKVHQEPAVLVLLHAIGVALLKQVIIELVRLVQLGAIDPGELRQNLLIVMVAAGISFRALVRPAIIPATVSPLLGLLPPLLHVLVPSRGK